LQHAKEVIELMAAFPGRDFRIREILIYASRGRELSQRERHAMRISVSRALQALAEAGSVLVRPPRAARGGFAQYRWRE
jgi:hypothetical protein